MQRRYLYGIFPLLLLIAGLLIFGLACRQDGTHTPVRTDLSISSADLAASFDANQALSDSLFLYKILLVRGIIQKIQRTDVGSYVITLGSQQPGMTAVDCNMDTAYNYQLSSLKTGDCIRIQGTCAGRLLNVILLQCIMEK